MVGQETTLERCIFKDYRGSSRDGCVVYFGKHQFIAIIPPQFSTEEIKFLRSICGSRYRGYSLKIHRVIEPGHYLLLFQGQYVKLQIPWRRP
jgi:hypothetical protein